MNKHPNRASHNARRRRNNQVFCCCGSRFKTVMGGIFLISYLLFTAFNLREIIFTNNILETWKSAVDLTFEPPPIDGVIDRFDTEYAPLLDIRTERYDLFQSLYNLTILSDEYLSLSPKEREEMERKRFYGGRVLREFFPRILNRKQRDLPVSIVTFHKEKDSIEIESLMQTISLDAKRFGQIVNVLYSPTSLNEWALQNKNESQGLVSSRPLLVFVTSSTNDVKQSSHNVDALFRNEASAQFFATNSPEYIVFEISVFRDFIGSSTKIGLEAINALLSVDYKVQVLSSSHFLENFGPNTLLHEFNFDTFLDEASELLIDGSVFRSFLFASRGFDLAIPSRRQFLNLNKVCKLTNAFVHGRCGIYYKESDDIYSHCNDSYNEKNYFMKKSSNLIPRLVDALGINDTLDKSELIWASHNKEASCALNLNDPETMAGLTCNTNITKHNLDPPHQQVNAPNLLWVTLDSISHSQMKRLFEQVSKIWSWEDINLKSSVTSLSAVVEYESSLIQLLDEIGYATFSGSDECLGKGQGNRSALHGGIALNDMFCHQLSHRINCLGRKSFSDHLINNVKQFIDAYHGDAPWAAFLTLASAREDSSTIVNNMGQKLHNLTKLVEANSIGHKTIVVFASNGGISYGPFYGTEVGRFESNEPFFYIRGLSRIEFRQGPLQSLFDAYNSISEVFTGKSISLPNTSLLHRKENTKNELSSCSKVPKSPSIYSFYSDIARDRRPRWPTCKPRKSTLSSHTDRNGKFRPHINCFCATNLKDWSRCEKHPWVEEEKHSTAAVVSCTESAQDISLDIRIERDERLVKYKQRGIINDESEEEKVDEGMKQYESNKFKQMMIVDPKHHISRRDRSKPIRKEVRKNYPKTQSNTLEKSRKYRSSMNTEILQKKSFDRHRKLASSQTDTEPPSILIVEVDSVSLSHAKRHFPQTNTFLQSHMIKRIEEGNSYECKDGLCAGIFNRSAAIGANSIPNQVAELSGCIHEEKFTAESSITKCFGSQSLLKNISEKGCIDKGQYFGQHTKTCRPCREAEFLINPLQECITRPPLGQSKCCTSDPRNLPICQNGEKDGLQLYKRLKIGGLLWCPKQNRKTSSPWIFDIVKKLGYITFFGEEFCYTGSPYIVQGNDFFVTKPDFSIHEIFCLLARHSKKGAFTDKSLWTIDHDSASKPKPCIDGRSRHQISHEYLIKIWDTYPDVPKFAYLNAIAAHDYGLANEYMHLGGEEYDVILSSFLRYAMTKDSFKNTVIIIRSDHGLQGGPAAIEYSTQQEHPHTWSNFLFHEGVIELDALYKNQDRLVTGHDLYNTIIGLVSRPFAKTNDFVTPSWSYDLFKDTVPSSRTCKDSHIPKAYCPCESERDPDFVRPRFNVTHESV